MARKLVVALLLLVLLGGPWMILQGEAHAEETMEECMQAGYGFFHCLWRIYMCGILTDCEGDYPW
jgi:hypothetical protein